MMGDFLLLLLLIALSIAIVFAIIFAYKYRSVRGQITEQVRRGIDDWKRDSVPSIRQDAIQQSQAVTLGKITEHFIPYLPDFSYNPKDARFIGSPIDFVVFDGLNETDVRKVVFVEVKTGTSGLSTRERRIRDAIQSGNVEWIELRPAFEAREPSIEIDEEQPEP